MTNKMPARSRPSSDKADLVDELARLGGDDYRFWGDDGEGTVDSTSQAFKVYGGVSVAVLRSRVADFSPGDDAFESDSDDDDDESSDESGDDEQQSAAAATPATWFGGIFGGPSDADMTAAKEALATGDISDDENIAASIAAKQSVGDSLLLAGLEVGAETEMGQIEYAIDDVIQDTQGMEPLRAAALVSVMSNELDRLVEGAHLSNFEGAEERSQVEQGRLVQLRQKLLVTYSSIPATDSKLTPNKPVIDQSRDERQRQDGRIAQRLQFDAHVSTAGAQHVAATVSAESESFESPAGELAPPSSPGVEDAVAAAIDGAEENERETIKSMARRVGSLVAGPPIDIDTAEDVTKITANLGEAPLVADLVRKGLLRTEDVLSADYVQAMESRLRAQAATKIAEGRDPRYTSSRAGYRAPVNVSSTSTPGVYRVKPRRFLHVVTA